jgi:hypothetical protein
MLDLDFSTIARKNNVSQKIPNLDRSDNNRKIEGCTPPARDWVSSETHDFSLFDEAGKSKSNPI